MNDDLEILKDLVCERSSSFSISSVFCSWLRVAGALATFDQWPLKRRDCNPWSQQSGFRYAGIGRLGWIFWLISRWFGGVDENTDQGTKLGVPQVESLALALWSSGESAAATIQSMLIHFCWSILIIWTLRSPTTGRQGEFVLASQIRGRIWNSWRLIGLCSSTPLPPYLDCHGLPWHNVSPALILRNGPEKPSTATKRLLQRRVFFHLFVPHLPGEGC